MDKKVIILASPVIIVMFLILSIFLISSSKYREFDGQRAYEGVKYQVELGPRTLGSEAHENEEKWIISSLENQKWDVVTQEAEIFGVPIKNIIAKKGTGTPWIIIASHYDSRLYADQDKKIENQKLPVDGANDGASSVAILLELSRILPAKTDKQIWLVFFDAEDDGNIPGYDWSLGSQYFVSELSGKPDSVVILDMIGDRDLNIYMERNSSSDLNQEIWGVASELGYTQFIPTYKYDLIDDHIPFIQAGIRAVDVIDFDYPYWHTTNDTLDKISVDSLKVVGDTILKWLEQYPK
jgi:Zn-dependent M28 family amino/carboxypeptidase